LSRAKLNRGLHLIKTKPSIFYLPFFFAVVFFFFDFFFVDVVLLLAGAVAGTPFAAQYFFKAGGKLAVLFGLELLLAIINFS
jgi:hypothetical protein